MKATHTPGPWKITGGRFVGEGQMIGAPSGHICRVYAPDNRDESANARLIAAAPELLAACKAVIGHGYCANTSSVASQDYVSKKAIAKVRAAIAKAEGGGE